ncbi:MAG: galactokinase [Spirochaetaceae bacterium]|jgi:galactokinase|nr:galactokinase [Spirochaetaceae bacterium]
MQRVLEAHRTEYESFPDIVARAPGRFHLMGEHSWFFGDKTLSMAVDLPVYVAISLRRDTALRFHFPQLKERKRANLSTLKYRREDRWANFVKAIIYGFNEQEFPLKGMNITVFSDVLPASGFGITTAIKAASAVAFRELFDLRCTDDQILLGIEKGNVEFLNGLNLPMDLYPALFSKPGTCILTDHSAERFDYLPFEFEDAVVLLTDARVPRIPVWDEDGLRTQENLNLLQELRQNRNGVSGYDTSNEEVKEVLGDLDEEVRRRLICIMQELHCVNNTVDALSSGNFAALCRAVNQSQTGMRELFEMSCPETDWLIKRVMELDTTGRKEHASSRITGKGFGGCTYTILSQKDVDTYRQKLIEYERIFGFHPVLYPVQPVQGASVVEKD